MLHLLLLILKIAGIILAIILGILILMISIVLFVPLCYQLSAKTNGTEKGTKVRCKITWLFSLLEFRFLYKDKAGVFSARIAWKQVKGAEKADEEKKEFIKDNQEEQIDTYLATEKEVEETPLSDEKCEESPYREADSKGWSPYNAPQDGTAYEEKWSGDAKKNNRTAEKIKKAGQKISSFFYKIKCTINGICDKINLFSEKKEKLIQFLENEWHKRAFDKAKKALIHLLKRICPKKGRIFLRYGLGDPALTGTCLAGLAVIYPFFPGDLSVVPEFEEKVFEGKTDIQGKLYFIHLLTFTLRLLVSKAVRRTYRDIREFISEF